MRAFSAVAVAATLVAVAAGADFYIPGMTARKYAAGAPVSVTVNSLRSLSTIIPYEYYHLPFCAPPVITTSVESMGQIIAGDRMESSAYLVNMTVNKACVKLQCPPNNNAEVKKRWKEVAEFIEKGYRGHMSIDNLPGFTPVGTPLFSGRCKDPPPATWIDSAVRGYALGVPAWCTGKTLLNNHLEFTVRYHKADPDPEIKNPTPEYIVVGFLIRPRSVHFTQESECDDTFNPERTPNQPLLVEGIRDGTQQVTWSYSVKWIEDPKVTWATRWDEYLNTSLADSNSRVHWVYIINSILITICLCVIAGMMLLRTLHKDCNDYNAQDADSLAEEMGWKLVHADVFRPPQYVEFLAIAIGNGSQMVLLAAAMLVFAILGFLSPANRGGLLTALLICFALFSMASGYVTSRVLKTVDRRQWKVIFGSAMIFPGSLFCAFLFIDMVNWHLGASDAVPIGKIFLIFLLWVGSCIPLNVLGAAYGFHQDGFKHPCGVGRLPREIPAQRWWLRPPALYVLPATFPFCAVFLELRFIFQSLWQGMVYYAFTFLAIVFVVWVVTVMLSTVIMVYYLLAYGDYRWWWSSFILAGGCGIHVYLYAAWFYFTAINITTKTGTLIFFVYMGYFAAAYGLAAGTIGFLTSYVFVNKIYSSIRID